MKCWSRALGPQQLRRMLGAVVAVVRGVESEAWLERCLGVDTVATPLVPAEAVWLEGFELDVATACARRRAGRVGKGEKLCPMNGGEGGEG